MPITVYSAPLSLCLLAAGFYCGFYKASNTSTAQAELKWDLLATTLDFSAAVIGIGGALIHWFF